MTPKHTAHPPPDPMKPARRAASRLFLSAAILCAAGPAASRPITHLPAARSASAPALVVADSGWGATDVAVLRQVLAAVAEEFARHLPERALPPVRVQPGGDGPIVLYERGAGGEYVVQLSARDGRWYQFVYQFAHEMCHVYSNFDNKPTVAGHPHSPNQWFEESLCEAAALYALRSLSARWASEAPEGPLREAAPSLKAYATRFVAEKHRQLAPGESLAQWFDSHRRSLRRNPYQREKDELVANRLLQLFERSPENWRAIGYLNARKDDAAKSFDEFLEAWCAACPEESKAFVREIIALFGTPASEPGPIAAH